MRRWVPVSIIILLLLSFVVIAQAIIGVKLLELRVKISRERILNYELSSRVLKERFINILESEKKSFNGEVKQNVLEAAIMNDKDPEALELSIGEYAGLFIINVVRKLSFKPFLHLMADQEQLLLMKYAFFMERNRRYKQAIEKYKFLEELMPEDNSDARGFVMLHHGYCLAVSGKPKQALEILYKVRDDFSGSHYSQTSIILIDLLLEGERQKDVIENLELSNLEKARRFFKISQYKQSIQFYSNEITLIPMDKYRASRSREETGGVPKAIEGYLEIIKENRDDKAVKLANRRLLLIGNFYGGGKKVKQFAEKKAKDIGDESAVKNIEVAAANRRKDIILEEIKENNNKSGKTDPLFEQLGKELEKNIVLDEKITKSKRMSLKYPQLIDMPGAIKNINFFTINFKEFDSPEAFTNVKPNELMLQDPGNGARMFPMARMEIYLNDGRVFQGQELIFKAKTVVIVNAELRFEVPILVINRIIRSKSNKNVQKPLLFLVFKDGKKMKIDSIVSIQDERIRINKENDDQETYELGNIQKILFP